jgi:hypothetical protein
MVIRQEAGYHAGAQYERMNPRPEFNGNRDGIALAYVTPEEEGSLVAAAVGALRGKEKRKTENVEVA